MTDIPVLGNSTQSANEMPWLGRRFAPDDNDHDYPMRAALGDVHVLPDWAYWPANGFLDQGPTGTCVYHAWYSLWMGSPSRNKFDQAYTPFDMYREGVLVDEWAQNDYEATLSDGLLQFGSSVRAGAKVAQRRGWIEGSYVWGFDLPTPLAHVLTKGPVVLGTNVTVGMTTPDKNGLVKYTGRLLGGHAYVWDGANRTRGIGRLRQSWRNWRYFYMTLEDIERLILDDGEACASTEIKLVA